MYRMASSVSNPLQLSDADAAVAEAREEVCRAQERLRSLLSYRNTFVPIEALPEEILLAIFYILVHSSFTPSYQWIGVTHVCRRWRTAALGCPVLWTRVHCAFPKSQELSRLDAFLERSQPCPIDVDLPYNTSWYFEPGFNKVLEHCHRWRNVMNLEITADFILEQHQLEVRKLELPLAEALDVHFGTFLSSRTLYEITNPSLPALQKLTSNLVHWPVLKTWLVPTLVHLEISGYFHLHTTSLTDWIGALRPLSLLQTLVLHNTFDHIGLDEDNTPAFPSPIHIHLPFLRKLRIIASTQSSLSACASLLEHIVSPWSTEVKLEAQKPFDVRASGYEVPFAMMAAREDALITGRSEEEDSVIWLSFTWTNRVFRMKVLDLGPTPERTLLDMQLPAEHYEQHRSALEGIVAHVVRSCPSLCDVSMLLLVNLGIGRTVWNTLRTSPVPQVLFGRDAFLAFLDALEADPGGFMPELDTLTVCTLPRKSRLPIPRPGQKVGHAQRPLLQRLADALGERRRLGMDTMSVNFGHGQVEVPSAAEQGNSPHAVDAGNSLRDKESGDENLDLPAIFGSR